MNDICIYAAQYLDGLLTKDEFLLNVVDCVLKLTDTEAMAFAILVGAEEVENDAKPKRGPRSSP